MCQYSYDFNPLLNWLADCGYLVLAPNFSGSTGSGIEHMRKVLGVGCGEADLADCLACAKWFHELKDDRLDLSRGIAVGGHSWGGYLALMSMLESKGNGEGYFSCGQRGANKVAMSKLTAGSVVSCLLNLDSGSECSNTISLFKDGRRLAPPQALPESLQGETLFPTLAFKCMTLQTNFGPEPMCDLPFKCHMVGAGSKTDLMFATAAVPKECEALFPVSLPDEGSFDWLDMFLEKNPSYIEISDRAVRDWAEKSANWTKRGLVVKSSNDKPEMCFNVRHLDDGFSVKKTLKAMAALQKRNYVVMEVKGNLIKEEREASMATFKENGYKVTAAVMVGTPPPEFKKKSLELLLKSKQEAIDTKHKADFFAEKKKWEFAKKQKEFEKQRKQAEKDRQKAAKAKLKELEEAKKKALAEKAKAEGKEPPAEEPPKEEEPEEEEAEEEEPEAPEPMETDPPKAELDAEEKKLSFRPVTVPDLAQNILNTAFTKFTLPEKADGFDDVRYEWLKDGAKAKKHVEEWIAARKLTSRVEEIQPSSGFYNIKKDWEKAVSDWHGALSKYKSMIAKKKADKAAKEAKKIAKEKAAAAKAAAAKAAAEKAAEEGKEPEKVEETPEEPEEEEEEEEEEAGRADGQTEEGGRG